MRDSVILDIAIERRGSAGQVGDRMRGRVGTVVPAMAGAFIVLPGGVDGFLPDSQAPPGLGTGDAVTVTVARAPLGGKGPRLSARGPQAEPGPPALLDRGPGAIARLLALHPGASVVVDDPDAAAGIDALVVARAWTEDDEAGFAAAAALVAPLPGGLSATIQPTRAAVMIDVDAGAATADRRAKPAAQRAANREALPALAAAIRVRNLSGAILIDFAGMAAKARRGLAPELEAALATDPLRPHLLGFTALGFAEILRPRVHPALHEMLSGPHAAGLAALRALARVPPPAAPSLSAAPDVARALDADPDARTALARRTGRALKMRIDPALPPGGWTLHDG